MDLLNELARTNIDPALLAQVQALFAQQQAGLAEKDFKITALTHELAYYRRVRFCKASESLVGEQGLLFEETVDMDLAAIEEELEGQAPAKPRRKRAGRCCLCQGLLFALQILLQLLNFFAIAFPWSRSSRLRSAGAALACWQASCQSATCSTNKPLLLQYSANSASFMRAVSSTTLNLSADDHTTAFFPFPGTGTP